jgi:phosphoribosylamine--glycine ligase
MHKQKILIIGGGGREHAVGWKIDQSPMAGELFFAPGNAGTEELGVNVDIKATEIDKLLEFAKTEKIDLTLALPDDPLALGIVDLFQSNGLKIWGPTQKASQLEWSKAFSKNFMRAHNLPTAKFETFTDYDKALNYLSTCIMPIVVKASGLALGKGVIIAQTTDEANLALEDMMVKKVYGEAGNEVVIEEFMTGPEVSTHAFSDGVNYKFFPISQDHKRIGEGDTGLNTGGMGTIAPVPFVDEALEIQIKNTIVVPTLVGMDYNARFGDPETQSYMRLLDTDLLEIINASLDKKLNELEVRWKENTFTCNIVLASGGYPSSYEKGKMIHGIVEAEKEEDIIIFHAGTKLDMDGNLVTNGGRVLGVSAIGKTLEDALAKAYKAIEKISFEGMQYRRDIGQKALNTKL